MKTPISVVFLATLALCAGHIGGGLMLQDINPQFYCGRNLAVAISELCQNQKNPKRSEGTLFGTSVPPYFREDFGWPWLAPHNARGPTPPSRGKRMIRGGLADECCTKPCSMEEMLEYCNEV